MPVTGGRLAGAAALAASIAFTAAVIAAYVPFPMGGDSAMFMYAARELADGARLYREFWDMKQPGIYWFNQIAGSLFGFDSVGARTLESLWMLALAIAVVALIRPFLEHRAAAALAPIFCVCPVYANGYLLTLQLELLVSLPLVAMLLCLLVPAGSVAQLKWRYGLAGALAAVVALFKLILVVIPVAVFATVLVSSLVRERESLASLVRQRILPATLGAGLCAGGAALYLWRHGTLAAALWTAFVYPVLAIEAFPAKPLWQLRAAGEFFLRAVWPLLPFAAIGAGARLLRRGSALEWALVAWLVAGAVAVSAQALSRWHYHFSLFFVPVGLLAVRGVDVLLVWLAGRGVPPAFRSLGIGCAIAFAVFVTVVLPVGTDVRRIWRDGPRPWADLTGFQERVEPKLARLRASAEFLRSPEALPGPIGLLGDTRMAFVSGRRPVPEINGWTYYLPAQLEEVAATLRRERPPYVYVSHYLSHIHGNGTDALTRTLVGLYFVRATDGADGSWYELRRDREQAIPQPSPITR